MSHNVTIIVFQFNSIIYIYMAIVRKLDRDPDENIDLDLSLMIKPVVTVVGYFS